MLVYVGIVSPPPPPTCLKGHVFIVTYVACLSHLKFVVIPMPTWTREEKLYIWNKRMKKETKVV